MSTEVELPIEFIDYCKENTCRQCQVNYAEHIVRFDIMKWMYKKFRIIGHVCNLY
jgi:hypothetical protein